MANNASKHNPLWTMLIPSIAIVILGIYALNAHFFGIVALLTIGLVGSVVAAVHHAEVIAHRVGEPFGTLVLALAVTIIEVALIVSMMISGGDAQTEWNIVMATAMLAMLPPALVVMLMQKWFVKGLVDTEK